jgi:hypothetical protein
VTVIIARCLAGVLVVVAATACSTDIAPTAGASSAAAPSQQSAARTAEQVVADLANEIGSARPSVVFTPETDPNKLLGRPNGYTSKASFTDARVDVAAVRDNEVGSVDQGGSVEVYADEAGAAARKKFIDDTMKAAPILGTEYSYVDGPILLRLSQALTPAQAAEYEAALHAS